MWITRVSIANPVFATMVMVALCVLGIFSYARLGVEPLPDIAAPVAFVDVAYPGASPEAVEREISKPIEEVLNGIAGVKRITSRSFEGRSQSSVEFSLNADMARAMQDVRDRVALVAPRFPRDAKAPLVARFDNDNAQPTVVLALLGRERGARELSMLADQVVAKRLQRIDGVARVQVNGMAVRQVRIDLDAQRLRQYGVTPAEIASALREANADEPVGLLSDPVRDTLLRIEGRVRDPRRFAEIVVARRNGLALTLGDLGTLVDREQEPQSIARIDGQPAVSFSVFRQQDANIVATGEAVKSAMEELRKTLPPGVELKLIYANSDWVKDSLHGLQRTLIEGALLTVAIVFLFLRSWRSTVITGLTLPIAVIASFVAVHAFGFTLNFMTMMALSLTIGLLIDDAIVVRENIVRHLGLGLAGAGPLPSRPTPPRGGEPGHEQSGGLFVPGERPGHWPGLARRASEASVGADDLHHRAALEGTDEIGLAVMATTFAICAVFVPVAFMSGIVGKFFYPFGITVTVAVLVSLFVSFTLDPMLSSVWKDPPSERLRRLPLVGAAMRGTEHMLDVFHDLYEQLVRWMFSDWRWRLSRRVAIGPRAFILGIALLSFGAALALVPVVGSEFIPQADQGFTQLTVRLPVGSALERSDAKIAQIERVVASFPEIETISTSIGGEGSGLVVGRNQAVLNLGLKPRSQRERTQKQVEDALREQLKKIPGIEPAVGLDRPIYVAVLGDEPETLARIATEFAENVKKIPGIVDVDLSVKPGLPAYAVRLEPGAVRELGLSAPQLASSLRAYVNGEVATYWTTPDGQQVEVQLRLPEQRRQQVEQLRALPVAYAKDGTPIALGSVASIEPVANPEVIRRQDLQRREAIFAGVKNRPAGDVGDDVKKLTEATTLPPGFRFDIGGATKDQEEAFRAMGAAMALAVTFIYIVLASQFGSFLQPIAIMASLPLALIGVMLALLLWRTTLNLFSMIGLVMLMGLVVKNAILLVDFANHARKAGASVQQALLQAGLIRMRPILMTTAAMIFGMLPLALALNDGGELQAPMGRAIIGGLITSTLLTLVVVPVIYSLLVRDKRPEAVPASGASPLPVPAKE